MARLTTNAGINSTRTAASFHLGEGRMFSSVSNKLNTSASVAGVSCTLDYNTWTTPKASNPGRALQRHLVELVATRANGWPSTSRPRASAARA
ncbi:MAG: hypothetical protein ACLRMJ_03675 [Alistipes finegoldii]